MAHHNGKTHTRIGNQGMLTGAVGLKIQRPKLMAHGGNSLARIHRNSMGVYKLAYHKEAHKLNLISPLSSLQRRCTPFLSQTKKKIHAFFLTSSSWFKNTKFPHHKQTHAYKQHTYHIKHDQTNISLPLFVQKRIMHMLYESNAEDRHTHQQETNS